MWHVYRLLKFNSESLHHVMTIVLEVRLISLSLYKCCKQMKCCSYDQEVTCQLLVIVSIHYYTVKYRYFNFNIARQVLHGSSISPCRLSSLSKESLWRSMTQPLRTATEKWVFKFSRHVVWWSKFWLLYLIYNSPPYHIPSIRAITGESTMIFHLISCWEWKQW